MQIMVYIYGTMSAIANIDSMARLAEKWTCSKLERERERERKKKRGQSIPTASPHLSNVAACVCVCVFVFDDKRVN